MMDTKWIPEEGLIIAHEARTMVDIYNDINLLRRSNEYYRKWERPITYSTIPTRLIAWKIIEGTTLLYKRDKREWE